MLTLSQCFILIQGFLIAQTTNPSLPLSLTGTWEGYPADSSFRSVLDYQLTPKGKMMLATNELYGKSGKRFAEYEGMYYPQNDSCLYLLIGPNGETHRGSNVLENGHIVHRAIIQPGGRTKSYKSMIVMDGVDAFRYYASYSENEIPPEEVDTSSFILYRRVQKTDMDSKD